MSVVPCWKCGGPKGAGQGRKMCDDCSAYSFDRRTWARDWARDNREKRKEHIRVNQALVRARKRGLVATLTIVEWLETLEVFGHRCSYCFGPFEALDHVLPLSHGGGTIKENCVPCCQPCNASKGGRSARGRASRSDWTPSIASRFWPQLAEFVYDDGEVATAKAEHFLAIRKAHEVLAAVTA